MSPHTLILKTNAECGVQFHWNHLYVIVLVLENGNLRRQNPTLVSKAKENSKIPKTIHSQK